MGWWCGSPSCSVAFYGFLMVSLISLPTSPSGPPSTTFLSLVLWWLAHPSLMPCLAIGLRSLPRVSSKLSSLALHPPLQNPKLRKIKIYFFDQIKIPKSKNSNAGFFEKWLVFFNLRLTLVSTDLHRSFLLDCCMTTMPFAKDAARLKEIDPFHTHVVL